MVYLIISVMMLLYFRIHYFKALVLAMLFLVMSFITEFVTIIVMEKTFYLMMGQSPDFDEANMLNIVAVISKILLFGLVLFTGKLLGRRMSDTLTRKEWWILFAISFITVFSLVTMVADIDLLNHADQSGFLWISMGMLTVNFVVYYLLDSIIEREKKLRESAIFREKVKSETAMYRSVSENLERQRKRTHEYKNQLAAIRALVEGKQYQELKKYIEKVDDALRLDRNAIDANHVIVNAILNTKYRNSVREGITFVLKVGDLSELKIEDEDLVVILSNLLNNALEACVQSREKVIQFKFILEDGQAVISVVNSIGTGPVTENGRLVSTKTKEPGEHGLGVQNVVEAVGKYGGRYGIEYGDGMFHFTILIPNKEET